MLITGARMLLKTFLLSEIPKKLVSHRNGQASTEELSPQSNGKTTQGKNDQQVELSFG